MSCLPDFIRDSFLKEVGGRPNNVSEALVTSFLASTFFDHAAALVIDRLFSHDVHISIREVSVCTPNMPWGIPLVDCPGCRTAWHLSAKYAGNEEVVVICTKCKAEGKASYPKNTPPPSFLGRPQLRQDFGFAISTTWPRPPTIEVDWMNVPTSSLQSSGPIPLTQPSIPTVSSSSTRVCSSCGRFGLAITCTDPQCAIALCYQASVGLQWPCLSIDVATISEYSGCPSHATNKETQFHIRNYSRLNAARALHPCGVIDLLLESSSTCGRKRYLPTHIFNEENIFSSFELRAIGDLANSENIKNWIQSQNSKGIHPDIVIVAQGLLKETQLKDVRFKSPVAQH